MQHVALTMTGFFLWYDISQSWTELQLAQTLREIVITALRNRVNTINPVRSKSSHAEHEREMNAEAGINGCSSFTFMQTTSRSIHYRSFPRRSSRQSLALVRTTKTNSKINQTNTQKNKIQKYSTYIHNQLTMFDEQLRPEWHKWSLCVTNNNKKI